MHSLCHLQPAAQCMAAGTLLCPLKVLAAPQFNFGDQRSLARRRVEPVGREAELLVPSVGPDGYSDGAVDQRQEPLSPKSSTGVLVMLWTTGPSYRVRTVGFSCRLNKSSHANERWQT